jgi:hypothetical protein
VELAWNPKNWVKNIHRPVLTASRPSQTIAQIGPLPMSIVVRFAENVKQWVLYT